MITNVGHSVEETEEWRTPHKLRCLVEGRRRPKERTSLVLNLGKKGRGTSKAVASFAAAFKQHKLRSQEPTAVDKKQKNWHGGKQPVFSCIYFYLKPPDQGAET